MLTDSFLHFIKKEKLFKRGDQLLLAISGGVDSVVLAHLLHQLGFQFSLAHMNFQLRGNDSELDQAFVEDLAKKLKVTCHVKRVKVQKGQTNGGMSTQMQARALRYSWFSDLMKTQSYAKLITAHHVEDSFETVLLNLTRGTGIKGVRGILPLSGNIARPLLFTDKNAILAYAKRHKLAWREDKSNQSDAYKRNEIRHHVIPLLKAQNPNIFKGFNASSNRLRAAEAAFDDKVNSLEKEFVEKKEAEVIISKQLLKLDFGLVYLAEMLKPYHFSYQQLSAFSVENSGSYLEAKNYGLIVDRDFLYVKALSTNIKVFEMLDFKGQSGLVHFQSGAVAHQLKWDFLETVNLENATSSNIAVMDYASLKQPLILRTWKEGDKMKPLGMRGTKKVSDILIDDKIPVSDKEKQLVLESDGEIVWLVNNRLSENYKITKLTSIILRLEYSAITEK